MRKQVQRNRERLQRAARGDAGLRHHRLALQRRRRDRALPGHRASSSRAGFKAQSGKLPRRRDQGLVRPVTPSCRQRARAISPRSPRRCAAITQHVAEQARARARAAAAAATQAMLDRSPASASGASGSRHGAGCAYRRARDDARPAKRRSCSTPGRQMQQGLLGRRAGGEGPRPRDPHQAHPAPRSRAPRCRKVRCRATRTTASCCAGACARTCPGEFPFTAGVFPFKRENEDPTRMFAGEGDPFRTNKRFHLLSRDMPAKRLSTAFDSVTLYGFDPDERPDIYGKVGNSRRVDRDARRHEGAVLGLRPVRSGDLGVDDDQRPGADDPRDVLQHRDRPAGREVRAATTAATRPQDELAEDQGADAARPCAARCRPTS